MLPIDSKYLSGELTAPGNISVPTLFSLNDVFRESLRKVQEHGHVQLVVRCEPLPQVQARLGEMTALIDDLLRIIISHSPAASRLFLYVDCEEDRTDVIDMALTEGFKRYTIKFVTNISAGQDWELASNATLTNCRQVLSRHHGSLVVNDLSSSGCKFSMTLPGKFE